jgi:glycosyltransferase involved in cell wall biosynthesis
VRLAVVSKFPPAAEGISDYGQHVARSLAARPEVERVTVLANRIAKEHVDPCRAVDVRRVWRANEPGLTIRLVREIMRARPSTVWFNVSLAMFGDTAFALGGFLVPALTRRLGLRTLVTLHELPTSDLVELGVTGGASRRAGLDLAVGLLLQSDVVCVTIDGHRRLLEQRRFGRAAIMHVPLCGYDDPELAPFPSTPTALILTSHAPHKNLPLLIEAFRRVRRNVPNARLLVAGIDHPRFPGYLGEQRARYASESGISWLGPVSDDAVRLTVSQATVVVAPYRIATGSSATVHRAIGLGRPVVATALPEFRSLADEEDLWLEFFPRNDSCALADALVDLLVNQQRCQEIARHNYRSARRNSLTTTTDTYLQLLRGVSLPRASIAISRFASGVHSH